MKVFKLAKVLYQIKYLSPAVLYRLIRSIIKNGINIMLLLDLAEKRHGHQTALVDDDETLSYLQLSNQSKKLALLLKEHYQLTSNQKVAFLCRNHSVLVQSIFAVSRLGANIYLLNTEMSRTEFNQLVIGQDFDLLIYDAESSALIEGSKYKKEKLLSDHETLPSISKLLKQSPIEHLKLIRSSASRIVLLTGGTTGHAKTVVHKPSIFNFLNPFAALFSKLGLGKYSAAYVATPIYHGYGIAILLLFLALGKKAVISKGFHAEKACRLIREHRVEAMTAVPLMIHKMIRHNSDDLASLACIASGGAELNPKLAAEVSDKLGAILYNLYGTSESGLNLIATPSDLNSSPLTVGKAIDGVQIVIVDRHKKEVAVGTIGQLCITNDWIMTGSSTPWIETGDLGYKDANGCYFLCGRTDDMVVSAGENVYPLSLEQVMISHPLIEEVAVIGIPDEQFGQRLAAFVKLSGDIRITEEELLHWLHSRIARYQMPREIVFIETVPYTSLGKLDRKKLKESLLLAT